jgi:hypothetical protein
VSLIDDISPPFIPRRSSNQPPDNRYVASDGRGYPLDLSTADDIELPFEVRRDTLFLNGARVGTILFLLNTKAHAWQTRIPVEQNFFEKRQKDAQDILFCLHALQGSQNIDRAQLRWIYTRHFWRPFLEENPELADYFRGAGLWTDDANLSSGSGGTYSSRSNHSFGSQPGTPSQSARGSRTGSSGRGGNNSQAASRTNSEGSRHSRR